VANPIRIVVALPDPLECAAVADWLAGEGCEPVVRTAVQTATAEMHQRAFDLLIADETFAFRGGLRPRGRVRNERVPTIVIGGAPEAPFADAFSAHAMYLARPVERAVLSCFVSMAILDGRPLRRSVRKPVTRFDAFANGLPIRLIDVSNEGMRLQLPPGRLAPLAPVFSLRIPLLGVAVTARRMWAGASPPQTIPTSYGAALAGNKPTVERAWRTFVDTIPVAPATGTIVKA
jgi:hypothetical protein